MDAAVWAMYHTLQCGMLLAGKAVQVEESLRMQVLVSCDDPIGCDSELIQRVEGVIAGTFERFGDHLSRVEVHLRDLNSEKPGARDLICVLQARLIGAPPVKSEHEAPTLAEAIHAAATKLERLVDRQLRDLFARPSNLRANMH
jgi:hypothetical protein